jgi:antitoxin VapB
LPREFCLTADQVEIFRRGVEIVLRKMPRTLVHAFELFCGLPDFDHHRAPQERDER